MNSSSNNSNYVFDNTQSTGQGWGYSPNQSNSPFDSFQNPQGGYQNQNLSNDNSLQGLRGFGTTIPTQNKPLSAFGSGDNSLDQNQSQNAPKPVAFGPGKTLTFEELIKNKTPAFFYFMKIPETAQQFAQSDINEMQRMFSSYNKTVSSIYFATCFLAFFGDRMLRQKNIIYGMTYRTSIFKFLCKFWLIPTTMTTIANKVYLESAYKTPMDKIVGRYNLSDPVFREAFERAQAQAKVPQNPHLSHPPGQQPQSPSNLNNVRML